MTVYFCFLTYACTHIYMCFLLLRSQLYLWVYHHLGLDFCLCDFCNTAIEVVTFRLRGWCMLGFFVLFCLFVVGFFLFCLFFVFFLLPPFVRPGHECQDLLSPCVRMFACSN